MPRLIATAFCLLLSASLAASDPATLLGAEGKVEWMKAGGAEWSPAQNGAALAVGDRLRTGPKSRAAVRLFDSSVLRIGALTMFELLPNQERPDKPLVDLKSGSLYFFSRQKPEDVRFRTPTISGAIRGTEFVLRILENGETELALIEGEVALRQQERELIVLGGELAHASAAEMRKQPLLNARNIVQWVLYYPIVLDPADLQLDDRDRSVQAYRRGNLRAALDSLSVPPNASPALKSYAAALDLAFGQMPALADLQDSSARRSLERIVAAVQFEDHSLPAPESASEWLAESFYLQSKGRLAEALQAAERAASMAANFGPAHVRVAELEFAHGRLQQALAALDRGLALSPDHAHGHAIRGFLHSASYRNDSALASFDRAIALDSSLGIAWLGRGLAKIKAGNVEGGRQDIQAAAALEPQRAIFRAYLAKAFVEQNLPALAEKDLRLALRLDDADPAIWLYSGLFHQRQNKINEAVEDLQRSLARNDNRQIHRSTFLLDQDRATRGANLASVYRDAGMMPLGLSQASRSVTHDYANYSSHLFLAQSYDLLRDPNRYNLRYETARLSELYLASLLSPVGGFTLSQNIGQQDAGRFFERNKFGVSSETEYLSRGAWSQTASQFGTLDRMAYSLDAIYRADNGQRPNEDVEQRTLSLQAKYQLTERDSIFLQALHYEAESGDVVQRYDQSAFNPDIRVRERHEPDAFLGFHREWQPGHHSLFLAGRSDLTLEIDDPDAAIPFLRRRNGEFTSVQSAPWHSIDYQRGYELYSAEAQQIWQIGRQTFIAGGRYQTAETEVDATLTDLFGQPRAIQDQENDFYRLSFYGYFQWQLLDSLHLTAGLSYDQMHYPRNIDTVPVSSDETGAQHLSPKAGLQYQPWTNGVFRAAFTRSLGGVSLDNNLRLEPTQIGGFNQAYRSLIPESVAGIAYGEEFQTISAGYDHALPTRTFVGVQAEHLSSEADRSFGILTSSGFLPVADTPANAMQQIEFVERSLRFYAHQLIGRDFVAGLNYRVAKAEIESLLPEVGVAVPGRKIEMEATLHEAAFSLIWNHPSGFFSQFESAFYSQDNASDLPGPGDEFFQHNLYVGYRFRQRAAEVRLGLLNLADQDYQLNPLNSYLELPRERTLAARVRLNF